VGIVRILAKHGDTTPFPEAPEICIEIVSPSNSDDEIRDKTQLSNLFRNRALPLGGQRGAICFARTVLI
jgi:hypothetical protein